MILKSLITKIIVSTTIILFGAMGTSWLFHMNIYESQLMDEVREKVETVLDTAETSISKSMRIGKTDDTQNILELVNSHMKGPSTVRIFHPDGIIIKSTNPKEIGKKIESHILTAYRKGKNEDIGSHDMQGRTLSKSKPIKNIRECHLCHGSSSNSIGILNAELSLESMDKKLLETRNRSNISAILISLILSLFISLLLYWIVIKPLSKLSKKMALAKKGDLTVNSGLKKNDEIGTLGQSFDSMIENLREARTELEKLHFEQMERADRLASVGELASGIAHEIKNPLAGIGGAVQILSRDFKDDKVKSKVVKEILQQIGRLDKSVKDLLNYASPSMPEFVTGDLNAISEKALFFVTQQPNTKNIEFIKSFDKKLPTAKVDGKQIQQVILNLLLNAIHAMEEKGKITISTFKSGSNRVAIKVDDTGKGIPEKEMAKLFVPFYTSREEGTGLGLSISKRLIEQHGGKIDISSEVGKGTSVTVYLPSEKAVEAKGKR